MSDRPTVPQGADADELRPRVLMVDDYPANLLVLEGILQPLGLELVSASSGEEALIHVLRADFALILMDVQMPGLDGFATAALIKNRERSRHIPIIFLTAISRDAEHVFEGYAHGAVDYLLKPFHPAILQSKVQVFVDLYRQSRTILRQQRELRQRDLEALEIQNERRFRDLTDALPSIVWGVAADGSVYYANRAWREYVGRSAEEPSDVFHLPGVHPDDAAGLEEAWRQALDTGAAFEWQVRIRRTSDTSTDGAWRWHLGRAVPQRDERGAVTGWIATSTDIDDRKRAERVLSYAARASSRLAESLSLATTAEAVADLLVPELATAAAVHLLSEPGASPRSLQLDVYREAEGPSGLLRAATTRLVDGSTVDLASALPTSSRVDPHASDEDTEWSEAQRDSLQALEITSSVSVPLTVNGRVLGALWAARSRGQAPFAPEEILAIEDLGRRGSVALEKASLFDLAQTERARAEQANRVKDEFLAAVSHELRSPLTAILGWTTMLIDGQLSPDKQSKALKTILRSAKTQTQLIEDLLDSAKITTGKLRLAVRSISLEEVVESAVEVVRPSAEAKQIELDVAVERDTEPMSGDPDRLQQVVWNLVANAIKFTPKGGRVSVAVDRSPDVAKISVRDEGEGVAADFLPFVFDAFRQADTGRSGLGLGLAISKELVALHGGTISVASEGKGRGTTFVVSLPTQPVEPVGADGAVG